MKIKNGIKFGIPLAIFGVLASTQSMWGLTILLAGLILICSTIIPEVKKQQDKKVIKRAKSIVAGNSTQTATGGISVVEGLIAVMIASIVGIGVVIPAVSKVSNETLNGTSVNPMFGPMINLMPTLIITIVLIAIVLIVANMGN